MKGVEIMLMALLGFIVIIMVIFWAVSQAGIGRQGTVISRDIAGADASISGIESLKRSLKESLSLSSTKASLQIAAAGGSYGGERLWWCNGQSMPPETDEVLWSMSNKSSALFQVYANTLRKVQDFNMTGYKCAVIKYPESCADSMCKEWNVSSSDGTVSTQTKDLKVIYDGIIDSEPKPNRFWWMYFRLYGYVKENDMKIDIPGCIPGDDTTTIKFAADPYIRSMVAQLENRFDNYVYCNYAYECGPDTAACETECPTTFNQQLCFSTALQQEITTTFVQTTTEESGSAAAKIAIKCVDQRYRIPDEKQFKELTWIIKAGVVIDYNKCPTTVLPPTLPPVTQPPVTRPPVTLPPTITTTTKPSPTTTKPKPPTTVPPVTQPPVTQPPVTNPPTTKPPTTTLPPPAPTP